MSASVFGIVFSNMHDESMQELTSKRTMASIPFGGRYRLIDFALSNMYNSGITKVGVITKSNYQSLMDHIGSGKEWDLSRKREGLYILPPFGSAQSGVYKGRLDALIGISEFIHRSSGDYVIMTDCDTICNLNYSIPLEYHIKNNADVTVITKQMRIDGTSSKDKIAYTSGGDGRVSEIAVGPFRESVCSIGLNMWIVNRSFLENILVQAQSQSLQSWERDVLQKNCDNYRIFSWNFDGYAGLISTMSQYFHTNMDLLSQDVRSELFFKYGHIYTKVRDEVPAKYGDSAKVSNSLIADGCVIEGEVENSIVFRGVSVGRGAKISNSIIMQSTRVDANVKLNYVIIDKDVFIKDNRILMGFESYPLYIAKGCIV